MATSLRLDNAALGASSLAAASSVRLTTAAAQFTVRDNTKFVQAFDPIKVIGVFKPTRTLVVGQSPAGGELVPVGTPVDLVVTVKEQIPLDGLKQIDPKILAKFNNRAIGDVLNTLANNDAKKVLDRPDATDYDALSTADKAVVNTYIRTTYDVDAAGDAAGAKSIYNNMKFLNDL